MALDTSEVQWWIPFELILIVLEGHLKAVNPGHGTDLLGVLITFQKYHESSWSPTGFQKLIENIDSE